MAINLAVISMCYRKPYAHYAPYAEKKTIMIFHRSHTFLVKNRVKVKVVQQIA